MIYIIVKLWMGKVGADLVSALPGEEYLPCQTRNVIRTERYSKGLKGIEKG